MLKPLHAGFLVVVTLVTVSVARGADSIVVWNPTLSSDIEYQALTPASKPGDWVYVDSKLLHPTQFCLGYREVAYKAKVFDGLSTNSASHDAAGALRPYLAKKDIPIIIGPDGTAYLTDGHHTLAGLMASSQANKTAFGHIVGNFFRKPQADFLAFMTDAKNNDSYLYGPDGNGLLNAPGALRFETLPQTVYSKDPANRMANDPYRSLGWAMKDTAYMLKGTEKRGEDEQLENFIEFRWGDLFRDKITWNVDSDDSFYIATANADVLAHSEWTTDLSGGFAARDLPGFLPPKSGETSVLNITDDTLIYGDIAPSSQSSTALAINSSGMILISGRLSHLAQVQINAGGKATARIDKGNFVPEVKIPPGAGTVVFSGESAYTGTTVVAAGQLMVNGSIAHSPVELQSGATLRGCGTVGTVAGKGTLWPGCTTGVLVSSSVDGASGLRFAFEFTGSGVQFDHPTYSRNDVLVLTSAKPFQSPLTPANEIDIYLRVASLRAGETFTGGIFANRSFTSDIAAARIRYFLADPKGAEILGNTRYSAIDPAQTTLRMDIVPMEAQVAATPVAGFVTRITVAGTK